MVSAAEHPQLQVDLSYQDGNLYSGAEVRGIEVQSTSGYRIAEVGRMDVSGPIQTERRTQQGGHDRDSWPLLGHA